MKKHYNIPIFIPQQGCPFQCIYCDQKKISSTYDIPDKQRIDEEIQKYMQTIPPAQEVEIAFFGGSFTAIDENLQLAYLTQAKTYMEKGLVQAIRVSTRPDYINEDIINFLYSHGVRTIELGIQSFNNEVLLASGRGYEPEVAIRACELIKKSNIKLGIQLMVGLPGDSAEFSIQSTKLARDLDADMVRIYPCIVIQGTELEKMWLNGSYQELSMVEAIQTTKKMLLIFQEEDIKVIRVGLYAGEDIQDENNIIAGPYHPAFKELVEQEIFMEQSLTLLSLIKHDSNSPVFFINPADISKFIGHRKANIERLKNNYHFTQINYKTDKELPRNTMACMSNEQEEKVLLSRKDFIKMRKTKIDITVITNTLKGR